MRTFQLAIIATLAIAGSAVAADETIRKVITNGSEKNPKMKSYKEIFSPTEIASLIPYIRSLKQQ